MMRCQTIHLLFCGGSSNYRPAKFCFKEHFIIQPINRYNKNFREKASLLFQSAKGQYFIFEILAFFCDAINYFNINYNEKRFNLDYGLFQRRIP
jgi:hypothetical protein